VGAFIDVAGFVMLVATALLAGGQLFCLLAVVAALPDFSEETSLRIHQDAMTWRPDRYMRIAGGIALLAGATTLVLLLVEDDRWAARVLVAVGVALAVASGIVSSREWPINDEIYSWRGREHDLARYAVLRRRWDVQHLLRTILSVLSLACLAAAVVVSAQL
jgi:uncharacterized protein YjeT (DUF2065 family)